MSGPEQRDEHRHENDPTGNGIVNHGPEKTPHTDPDRPHEGSAVPEPGETPEPAPPARADSEVAEDPDGQGPGRGTAEAAADTGTDAAEEPAAEPAAGKDTASDSSSNSASGKGPGSGAPDDDLVGTLTDLFARDRGAPASDELDEVALRRMLHGAVRELAPSEGTLDHLHRAVPARRARRRQAVVGAAAAALLIGTAVPAFVHVATSDGPSAARPAIAGHGEQAQGGNGDETGPEAPGRMDRGAHRAGERGQRGRGRPGPQPHQGRGQRPRRRGDGRGDRLPERGLRLPAGLRPEPARRRVRGTGAPGADGTVYGSFKIANVSGTDCTVSSNGTVGFTAIGAADPLKIGVVQHTAGDAAPGLPDPSQEPGTVLLKPAMAYEVRFAWVPTDTCPTVGPSPSPTPSTDGAGGSVGEGGTDQPSGVDTQSLHEDGGATAEGSVAVTHTPETGAPTAETKIPNACSGTIYRTGVLATS